MANLTLEHAREALEHVASAVERGTSHRGDAILIRNAIATLAATPRTEPVEGRESECPWGGCGECASEFEGQYTDSCPGINIASAIRAMKEQPR